jgi:hypothetical protein
MNRPKMLISSLFLRRQGTVRDAALAGAFCAMLPAAALATWKPEFGRSSDAVIAWFRSAQPTPAAQARLGFKSCCEHSDRFVTQFKVSKVDGADQWFYQAGERWLPIPGDVVHLEGITPPEGHENDPDFLQLQAEGILFLYPAASGQPTCFWPPQSGG